MKRLLWVVLFALAPALAPVALSGQTHRSIGAGITVPVSEFGERYYNGYTVRGQLGLDLVLLQVHAQGGWSQFAGNKVTVGTSTRTFEDVNLYHAGLGARVGIGVLWVGATGAYFFGDVDPDGFGVLPEVGVGVGPVEFVADYRLDGDVNWYGIRAALRF